MEEKEHTCDRCHKSISELPEFPIGSYYEGNKLGKTYRALYEGPEIEEYEHKNMLGDDLTSSNQYFNKINLYYNETEFINYEESHDVDKYKKSYYKLLKVCIPQLRRGHA